MAYISTCSFQGSPGEDRNYRNISDETELEEASVSGHSSDHNDIIEWAKVWVYSSCYKHADIVSSLIFTILHFQHLSCFFYKFVGQQSRISKNNIRVLPVKLSCKRFNSQVPPSRASTSFRISQTRWSSFEYCWINSWPGIM